MNWCFKCGKLSYMLLECPIMIFSWAKRVSVATSLVLAPRMPLIALTFVGTILVLSLSLRSSRHLQMLMQVC